MPRRKQHTKRRRGGEPTRNVPPPLPPRPVKLSSPTRKIPPPLPPRPGTLSSPIRMMKPTRPVPQLPSEQPFLPIQSEEPEPIMPNENEFVDQEDHIREIPSSRAVMQGEDSPIFLNRTRRRRKDFNDHENSAMMKNFNNSLDIKPDLPRNDQNYVKEWVRLNPLRAGKEAYENPDIHPEMSTEEHRNNFNYTLKNHKQRYPHLYPANDPPKPKSSMMSRFANTYKTVRDKASHAVGRAMDISRNAFSRKNRGVGVNSAGEDIVPEWAKGAPASQESIQNMERDIEYVNRGIRRDENGNAYGGRRRRKSKRRRRY